MIRRWGCICGRAFAAKSARARHCNGCPAVLAYRQRVAERLDQLGVRRQS